MTRVRSEWAWAIAVWLTVAVAACSQAPVEGEKPADEAASAPAATGARVVSGRAPVQSGVPSIVVLEPKGQRAFAAPSEVASLDQVSLTFIPNVMYVRTGVPAEFWNSDEVLHNVRVMNRATKEGEFNVSVPTDQVYRHTFKQYGLYDVTCDVHPAMMSILVASAGPYMAEAGAGGAFTFEDVEPGTYTAIAYVGQRVHEKVITVEGGRTEVVFEAGGS